ARGDASPAGEGTMRYGRWPGAVSRAAWFAALWLVIAGADPADLPVGAVAAAVATWTSLLLLPAGGARVSPVAMARPPLRFLFESVVAGADVARRALDPRLPLRPGFVAYPVRFPPGTTRNVFTTLTSLLPGTVPIGEEGGDLVYHCLDVDQPVVAQLSAEEAALSRALGDDCVPAAFPRLHPGAAGAAVGPHPARSGKCRPHDGGSAERAGGHRLPAAPGRSAGCARRNRRRAHARAPC